MERVKSPHYRFRDYQPPTDIEGNNKKLNRKRVKTGVKLRRCIEESIEKQRNNWDALAAI